MEWRLLWLRRNGVQRFFMFAFFIGCLLLNRWARTFLADYRSIVFQSVFTLHKSDNLQKIIFKWKSLLYKLFKQQMIKENVERRNKIKR